MKAGGGAKEEGAHGTRRHPEMVTFEGKLRLVTLSDNSGVTRVTRARKMVPKVLDTTHRR
eukprot:1315478-Amorphochlora_amoeboformis.AAC.1